MWACAKNATATATLPLPMTPIKWGSKKQLLSNGAHNKKGGSLLTGDEPEDSLSSLEERDMLCNLHTAGHWWQSSGAR